jgi:anti-sigma B factor antagonist
MDARRPGFIRSADAPRMVPVMSLSVTINVAPDGGAVLSVRGEVDHANAGDLKRAIRTVLADRRPHTIRIDLGLVTFIDSGAVGSLVAAHRMAQAEGVGLVVSNVSPFVGRQLVVAGVAQMLGAPVPLA